MATYDIDFDSLKQDFGSHITGQISVTYDLKQTYEQFIEVTTDSALEGDIFTEEDFLEYVKDNVAEQIRNEVLYNGEKSLLREIELS